MKRILITAALVVLTAGAALAQGHGMGPGTGPMAGPTLGPNAGPANGPDILAEYLQLTADQRTQWQTLAEQQRTAMQPLIDKQIDLQKQLQTALQATSPVACDIGNLILQIRAVGDQIKAVGDDYRAKREAILTPDQKTKLAAFEAAMAFIQQHQPGPGPNGPGR